MLFLLRKIVRAYTLLYISCRDMAVKIHENNGAAAGIQRWGYTIMTVRLLEQDGKDIRLRR